MTKMPSSLLLFFFMSLFFFSFLSKIDLYWRLLTSIEGRFRPTMEVDEKGDKKENNLAISLECPTQDLLPIFLGQYVLGAPLENYLDGTPETYWPPIFVFCFI